MSTLARTSVFISYSHADERWRKLVEDHLAPLGREHKLRIWSDKSLKPGEPWLARIKRELATARVGIMLVSHKFMASDFIQSDELPPLLQAAKQEGVILLTVIVGHCHFANSPLSKLQAFNKPDKPLEALSLPQRNKEMARLCALLMKIFGLKSGAPKLPAKPAAVKDTAAPKAPKRIATTKTGADAEKVAAKAKAIAKRKAIAKSKVVAVVKEPVAQQETTVTKKPVIKKVLARPAATRAKKK